MSDAEPQPVDLPELTAEGRSDEAVLVIGAESSATPAGLRLRFSRARVWSIATVQELEPLVAAAGTRAFDTVVVDGPALGPDLSGAALGCAGPLVRPDGRIVLVMDRRLGAVDGWSSGGAGLAWHRVAMLGDQPCAVLGPGRTGTDGGGDDAPGRLATLAQALLAAERRSQAAALTRSEASERVRNRSEAALLVKLRSLAGELAAERARREEAEAARRSLLKRYESLEMQHRKLLASKLGRATTTYWRLRKGLRRRLDG